MLNVCGAHRQYKDMPSASGSWSRESIGIEDQSGSRGVQISYGTIPAPATATMWTSEVEKRPWSYGGRGPGPCSGAAR